jgi:predicted RNA-binding protein with PIN domain
VARSGEEDTPVVPAPVALRPFLNFAKLSSSAVAAARRAVDNDDDFRARVAEEASQDEVGRAGWLWLTRPDGWQEELDAMASGVAEAGEAAAERRAENEARRRLEGAQAATRRAEAAAAAAQAESVRATTALAEERRARRAATEEAEDLARRLEQVTAERDQARNERDRAREEGSRSRRRVAELAQALEELRSAPPPAPAPAPAAAMEPAPTVDPEEIRLAGAALLSAAGAAAGMAESLRRAAEALAPAPAPPPEPPPAPAVPRRPRPPRRTPVPLPPGVLDDSVEAADHLFRVPGVAVLVDGYNASKLGWFDLPIAEQRRRLVDALTEMAMRTNADVSVVFDGAEPVWPASVPTTARVVRVTFSPPKVEADDVILARVADLDPSRPVVVASSDRRVQDGAAAQGANVISSDQLLSALRR